MTAASLRRASERRNLTIKLLRLLALQALWIGSAGVDGMDARLSMPGYHGALEIGYTSMAMAKWFLDIMNRTDGIFNRYFPVLWRCFRSKAGSLFVN